MWDLTAEEFEYAKKACNKCGRHIFWTGFYDGCTVCKSCMIRKEMIEKKCDWELAMEDLDSKYGWDDCLVSEGDSEVDRKVKKILGCYYESDRRIYRFSKRLRQAIKSTGV